MLQTLYQLKRMSIWQDPIRPALSGFREILTEANEKFSAVARKLLEVTCAALEVKSSRLMPAFECPTTWLRLLHYPPQPPPKTQKEDLYGSAPHTDFGSLTLLAQDSVAGLQVQTSNGDWLDVMPDRETLIVNVGDMLHRWSNGILKSTPHSCLLYTSPSPRDRG